MGVRCRARNSDWLSRRTARLVHRCNPMFLVRKARGALRAAASVWSMLAAHSLAPGRTAQRPHARFKRASLRLYPPPVWRSNALARLLHLNLCRPTRSATRAPLVPGPRRCVARPRLYVRQLCPKVALRRLRGW